MSKPFETTFATLRRGAASMEATEAMQQVVKSVYETGKPAKLVIELTVKPNTKNGGMVEAVVRTATAAESICQGDGSSCPEAGRAFVRRTAHLFRPLINKPFNPYGTLNRGCQTKAH